MKVAPFYLLSLVSMLLIRELNCKETAHHHNVRSASSKPGGSSRDETDADDSMLEEIEFTAMLIRCPQPKAGVVSDGFQSAHKTTSNISAVRSEAILQFPGYERDEGLYVSNVAKCRRKVVITLKIHSRKEEISSKYRYVVVDHVFDPLTGKKSRLANMYVVKVKVQPSLQLYGLHFENVVNGEVKEEVISKATNKTFPGCDSTSNNPTCGTAYFNGKKIPYSEGFCCSCNASVNARRQPSSNQHHNVMQPPNHMYSPAYHDDTPLDSNVSQPESTSVSNLNHTTTPDNKCQTTPDNKCQTTPDNKCQTTPTSLEKKSNSEPDTREWVKESVSEKKLDKPQKQSTPIRKQTVKARPVSQCRRKKLNGKKIPCRKLNKKLENEAKKNQCRKPAEACNDKPIDTKNLQHVGSSDDVKGFDEKHVSSCQTKPASTTTASTTATSPCSVSPSVVEHLRESEAESSKEELVNRSGGNTKPCEAHKREHSEEENFKRDSKPGTEESHASKVFKEKAKSDTLTLSNGLIGEEDKHVENQHQNSIELETHKSSLNIEKEASEVCFGDVDLDKIRTNLKESEAPKTPEVHESKEDQVSLENKPKLSNHYREENREELVKQLSKDTPELTKNELSEKVHENGNQVEENKDSNSQLSSNIFNPCSEPMETQHKPLKHHRVDYQNHDELEDNLKPKINKNPPIFSSDGTDVLNQDHPDISPVRKNCNPQQSLNVYSFDSKPINNQISSQQGNRNQENFVKYQNNEAFEYGTYKPLLEPKYEINSRMPNHRETSKNYEPFTEHKFVLLPSSETQQAFITKNKYAQGNRNHYSSSKSRNFPIRKPTEAPMSSEELAQKYFKSALRHVNSQSQHAMNYQPYDHNVEGNLKSNTRPQISPSSYNYYFNNNQRPSEIRPSIKNVYTPTSSSNRYQNTDSLISPNHNGQCASQMKQPFNYQPRDRTAHKTEVNPKTSVNNFVPCSTANSITDDKVHQGNEMKSHKPNTMSKSDKIHIYKETSKYDQMDHNANQRNQANSAVENRKYTFKPQKNSKPLAVPSTYPVSGKQHTSNTYEAGRNHPANVNLTHACTTQVPKQNTNNTCKAEACVTHVNNPSESFQKCFNQKHKGKCKFVLFQHKHESPRKFGSPSESVADAFLSEEHTSKPFNFLDLFHEIPEPPEEAQSPAGKTGKHHPFLKESRKLFEKLGFKHKRPADKTHNAVEKQKSWENSGKSAKVGNTCTDKTVSTSEAKCHSTAKPCKSSDKPCTQPVETNTFEKTGTHPSNTGKPKKPTSSSEKPCESSKPTCVPTSTIKPCKSFENPSSSSKATFTPTSTAKPCKTNDNRFDAKNKVETKTTAKPCKPNDNRFDATNKVETITTAKPCKPNENRFDATNKVETITTEKPCKTNDNRLDTTNNVETKTTEKPCKTNDNRLCAASKVGSKPTAKPRKKIGKHLKNIDQKTYLIETLLHDSDNYFNNRNRKLQDVSTSELLSVPSSLEEKDLAQVFRIDDLEHFNNEARIHKADELANYPVRDSIAMPLAKNAHLNLAEDLADHGRDMIDTLTRNTPQCMTQASKLDNEISQVKSVQQVSQPTNEELLRAYNSLFETNNYFPASNSHKDGIAESYINKILNDASFSNPIDRNQLKYPSLGDGLESNPRKRRRCFAHSKELVHRTRKNSSHKDAKKLAGCVVPKRSLCHSQDNKCKKHSNEIQIKPVSYPPHLKLDKRVKEQDSWFTKQSLRRHNKSRSLADRLEKAHHRRPGAGSCRVGPCIPEQNGVKSPGIGILEHCTDDLQPEKNHNANKSQCKTSEQDSELLPASRKSYEKTLQSGTKQLEDRFHENVDDGKRIKLGSDAPLKEKAEKHHQSCVKKQKRKLEAIEQDEGDILDFRRNLLRQPEYDEHSDELFENPSKEFGVDHSHSRSGQDIGVERSVKTSQFGHRVNAMNYEDDDVNSVPHSLTKVVPVEIAESKLGIKSSQTESIDSDEFELVSPVEVAMKKVTQSPLRENTLRLDSLVEDELENVLLPSEETFNENTEANELFPNKRNEERKTEMTKQTQVHSNLFRGLIRDTPFVDSFVQYDESDPYVEGDYDKVRGDHRFTVAFAEDGEVRVRRRGLRKNATKVIVDADSLSFFPVGSSEVDYIDCEEKEDAEDDVLKGDVEADGPTKDADKNYDGRIPLKVFDKVKRSPHGGGNRNHLKVQIPIKAAKQDIQEGKPKLDTNQAKPNKAYDKKEYELKNLLPKRHARNVKSETFEIPLDNEDLEDLEDLEDSVDVSDRQENSRGREKRQMLPSGVQVRGGQYCPERCKESDIHYPAAYHESAHCLRFSDLWYNVYSLDDPVVSHSVHVQLLERITLEDGSTHWHDHTAGQPVKIGTFNRRARDKEPTVSFEYQDLQSTVVKFSLDPQHSQVLIPVPVPSNKQDMYPEAQGGPGEYLVVPSRLVDASGEECDVAGVSYEGFSRQPDRCNKRRGACLANQPAQMWREDMKARIAGARGTHFLENYGGVPTRGVLTDSLGARFLALFYDVDHVAGVAIEVKADFNSVIRVGATAQITEIHADSTAVDVHTVSVVVTNTGLASSRYAARITDCPAATPGNWSHVTGALVNIAPQHTQTTRLQLDGQLPAEVVHCSVEVVNDCDELVATRRFRLRRSDRCLCVWACLCACVNAANGLKCDPASDSGKAAAGFGSGGGLGGIISFLPFSGSALSGENGPGEQLVALGLAFLFIALFLGVLKALLGFFFPKMSAYGINLLFCFPVKLPRYHEQELQNEGVVYDENGFPVHPQDQSHSVHAFHPALQFLANLLFFVVLPFALVVKMCKCCICGGCNKGSSGSLFEAGGGLGDRMGMGRMKKKMGACGDKMCFDTYDNDAERESDAHNLVRNELRKSKQELGKGEKDPLLGKKDSPQAVGYVSVPSRPGKPQRYVDKLVDKRNVYKSLNTPEHGVEMPEKIPYCIRGFFLRTVDGYKWVTPEPLMQYWAFSFGDLKLAKPPRKLNARDFEKSYRDADEVYTERSLSLLPRGFCINVKFQDDMQLIEDDDTSRGTFTGDSEQSQRSRPMRR